MNRLNLGVLGSAALLATLNFGSAHAAPVYIGLQEAGTNSGKITQEATGSGSASTGSYVYGTFYIQSITAEGTPPLPEPDLNSSSMTINSPTEGPGTLNIFITELNQNPTNFSGFVSTFGTSLLSGSITQVVESTFVTECGGPGACPSSDIFATGTLLSTTTFTSTGTVTKTASAAGLAATYAITEEYTLTAVASTEGNPYGMATSSIDLSTTPVPAALPLFATGLGALGLFGCRRKRKNAAFAA